MTGLSDFVSPQVTSNSTAIHTRTNIPILKNEYLYIYTSNEARDIDSLFAIGGC